MNRRRLHESMMEPGYQTIMSLHRRRRQHSSLHESSAEVTQFLAALNPAISHFQAKQGEVGDLPADSPERLLIEGVLGILMQYHIDSAVPIKTSDLRNRMRSLTDKLADLYADENAENNEIKQYLTKFVEGINLIHDQMGAAAAEDLEPDAEPDQIDDSEPSEPEKEPETEEDDEELSPQDDLLQKLGLA